MKNLKQKTPLHLHKLVVCRTTDVCSHGVKNKLDFAPVLFDAFNFEKYAAHDHMLPAVNHNCVID